MDVKNFPLSPCVDENNNADTSAYSASNIVMDYPDEVTEVLM